MGKLSFNHLTSIMCYDNTKILDSKEARVKFFLRWLVFSIIFKIELPIILCHYPTKNEITEKESNLTDTIITECVKMLYRHFILYPYTQPGSFLKYNLERSFPLFKDKYPNIIKNPNSEYMFGNDIEDLYTSVLDTCGVLIITDLQIQNFPSNAVLYVDPNPNPYPFMDAQKLILRKMHRIFEENFIETGRISYTSEEEKEWAFEAWLETLQDDPDSVTGGLN